MVRVELFPHRKLHGGPHSRNGKNFENGGLAGGPVQMDFSRNASKALPRFMNQEPKLIAL